MDLSNLTEKTGTEKLVFFLLLAVIVLAAKFVVEQKKEVTLSQPITLPYSGLSVSLPEGKGWKSNQDWELNKNQFVCISLLSRNQRPVCIVNCRYYLYETEDSLSEQVTKKAAFSGSTIRQRGSIREKPFPMRWARMADSRYRSDIYFAVAQLPDHRRVTLEFFYAPYYRDIAKRAFNAVVNSLNFEHNNLLKNGSELVSQIKEEPFAKYLTELKPHSYYMINDQNDNPVGFNVNIASIQDSSNSEYPVKLETMTYLKQPADLEQVTLFQSDYFMDKFHWKSETVRSKNRSNIEMVLNEPNKLTVRNYTSPNTEKTYRLPPYSLPETTTELLYKKLIQSDINKAVVDVLRAESSITPLYIEEVDPENSTEQDIWRIVKAEVIDGKEVSQRIYLNSRGVVEKIILTQSSGKKYILEAVSSDKLIETFPEHTQTILQKENSESESLL